MFGSATFDLVVGMVFVYLLLSLVVSAVREAIEARLKARARHLAHGMRELLGSDALYKEFYSHPLVNALFSGEVDMQAASYAGSRHFSWILDWFKSFAKPRTNMPSYVPARTFALAVIDLAMDRKLQPGTPAAAATGDCTLAKLRATLDAQGANGVAKALRAALAPVGQDMAGAMEAIQHWYDGAMDRVSGWYKRDSQHILFWLGLLVAAALNIDSIYLAKFLAANDTARTQLLEKALKTADDSGMSRAVDALRRPAPAPAAAASAPADDPASLQAELRAADIKVANAIHSITDLNLPVGWTHTRWHDFTVMDMQSAWTVMGWFITAFGLSFGAPFWFDLLNRLMVIRSTVKPHEKSPEEASEDRQPKPAAPAALAPGGQATGQAASTS